MSNANQRIEFLDGLRGWAAFVVLIGHLYPCWLYPPSDSPLSQLFYHTPLKLFTDGPSAVILFFLLSGFVLSFNFFKNYDYNALISMAQFRYFRLLIPILCSVLISYLFMRFNLMYTVQDHVGIFMSKPRILTALKFSFFEVFFVPDTRHLYDFGLQLWTMSREFIGSFLVFAFLSLFGTWKIRPLIYLIILPIFYKHFYYYFLFFTGLCFCDLYILNKKYGYLLQKYKLTLLQENSLYAKIVEFFNIDYLFDTSLGGIFAYLYQLNLTGKISAAFPMIVLLFWALTSDNLKSLFTSKISLFLGKISFALYLTHLTLLCSLSHFTNALLTSAGYPLLLRAILVSLVTLPTCLAFAYIFTLYVEDRWLKKVKSFFINKGFIANTKNYKQLPQDSSTPLPLPAMNT
ncbi:acyltransferase family protein [Legionella beliardensis]|nr:acyltransferase [Legionella beliardensis]